MSDAKVNFDELDRARTEALGAGYGSARWIKCAQMFMDRFPSIYRTAQAMNEQRERDRRTIADLQAMVTLPPPPAELPSVHATAPATIYLQVGPFIEPGTDFRDVFDVEVCWCKDQIDKNDIPYIRADLADNKESKR